VGAGSSQRRHPEQPGADLEPVGERAADAARDREA
jgi:hypothetical protein